MSIQVHCPGCSRSYTLKDELAGKKFKCKGCQAVVAIPRGEEEVLLAEVADDAEEDLTPIARPRRKKKSKNQAGTKAVKIVMIVALVMVGGWRCSGWWAPESMEQCAWPRADGLRSKVQTNASACACPRSRKCLCISWAPARGSDTR